MHKQLETMKTKGFTTSEIRKDIQAMESEQESVQRKIERLKQKVNQASTCHLYQNFYKLTTLHLNSKFYLIFF